jgi:uncharacterized membrane protein (DUF373 family)
LTEKAPRSVKNPPAPLREAISRQFTRVEDVVYVCLGILLAASAAILLFDSALLFVRGLRTTSLASGVINLLDRILLVLMIVEILYTVQVSFRDHVLTPEPFLIVGLIAATRRILVITAEFSELLEKGDQAFRNAMVELGLLTFLVVAMVASLLMLRKRPAGVGAERA